MSRVLVVDDESSIRVTLGAFLRNEGYEVATAADAQTARQMLQKGAFDVVVSDIVMPRMTGVELLRVVREASPRAQVILMTGEPTAETAAEAIRAGAYDYLFKPVSKEAILRSVGSAARIKVVDDERHRLAEANRLYQENLEQLVGERTRALEQAMEELTRTQQEVIKRERLMALGQMVSGIAHDFNNVLMPIMGLPSHLLSRPDLLENRQTVTEALKCIQSAANDARDIVLRLREFYRPDDQLELRSVVMKDVIRHAISATEPVWKAQAQADGKEIVVETDFRGARTVQANDSALREMLTNLMLNAVDAISGKGSIRFATFDEDRWNVLQVSDTGSGMPEEVRRRCFEPFFSTKGDRGTGLGLAMCYGIVQRHAGRIDVDSEIGRGTTFTIRLPQGRAIAASAETPPAPGPQERFRVLLVDDKESSRTLVSAFLGSAGHAVETAHDGPNALRMLQSGHFDLVITDRAMPGMRGDEVARAVKHITPSLPVLMLTGFGDFMKHKSERPEGVDEILGKPISSQELNDAIQRVVQAAHTRAGLGSPEEDPDAGRRARRRRMGTHTVDDDARSRAMVSGDND